MNARQYGVVSADDRAKLSGLELVRGFADGSLPLNTMARTLGYDIAEADNGRVVAVATPTGDYLNPQGSVHGAFAAALLDTCMGLAIRSILEQGFASTTLEFKISFIRPITAETGPVRAEGIVLNCGRRVGTSEGRMTDAQGRLLAHGTTTCLISSR